MPEWIWYLLLIPAGFIAGVVNTLAGGGSFLTLPSLMLFCGLDSKLANGTNRIAILLSSASASATFHKHGHLDRQLAVRLTIPTLLGVPLGSLIAIYLPNQALKPLFGIIFLGMAAVLASNPKRLVAERTLADRSNRLTYPIFFAIGVYVGFIQAGMGILLLLAMSLLRTGDLIASNAVKNVIGFAVTLAATLMFILFGQVAWLPGLIMAAGNVLGGVVGARLAIERGNRLIFGFVLAVMVVTGLRFLYDSIQIWFLT